MYNVVILDIFKNLFLLGLGFLHGSKNLKKKNRVPESFVFSQSDPCAPVGVGTHKLSGIIALYVDHKSIRCEEFFHVQ